MGTRASQLSVVKYEWARASSADILFLGFKWSSFKSKSYALSGMDAQALAAEDFEREDGISLSLPQSTLKSAAGTVGLDVSSLPGTNIATNNQAFSMTIIVNLARCNLTHWSPVRPSHPSLTHWAEWCHIQHGFWRQQIWITDVQGIISSTNIK